MSVISDELVRFKENGLVTADGKDYEFDIIVCATGFDVAFAPHLLVAFFFGFYLWMTTDMSNSKMTGVDGVVLQEEWAEVRRFDDMMIEHARCPDTVAVPQHISQRCKSQIPQLFHSRRTHRQLGPRVRPGISMLSPKFTLKIFKPFDLSIIRPTKSFTARNPSRIRHAVLRQDRG